MTLFSVGGASRSGERKRRNEDSGGGGEGRGAWWPESRNNVRGFRFLFSFLTVMVDSLWEYHMERESKVLKVQVVVTGRKGHQK